MGDVVDPYREALVVEEETVWPQNGAEIDPALRAAIHKLVHEQPGLAGELFYIRVFTGFCRRLVLRPEDLERLVPLARQGERGPEEKDERGRGLG